MEGMTPSIVTRARSTNTPKGRSSGLPSRMALVALFSRAVGGAVEGGGGR